MKDTFNSILTKIIVVVIVVFLMFGEYVALQIYCSDTGHFPALFGTKSTEIAEDPSAEQAEESSETASSPRSNIEDEAVANMVELVGKGVVNIETKIVTKTSGNPLFDDPFFWQFFGGQMQQQEYEQSGLGTGFIITEDGYIVTNQHVIENATEINVTINEEDTPYKATVVGEDRDLDLAVIKIESTEPFTPLKLGDSDAIRVGEWVTAIGNPYGLDRTVTVGVISATGRPLTIEDRNYRDLIQTDAAINPGNSGGPLLNLEGEVVGINTAVNSQAQGIGFAISINTAKEVLDSLISTGKVLHPYIGIGMQNVDARAAALLGTEEAGVVIAEVLEDTPAEKAGLQQYDVITAINDTKISDIDSLQDCVESHKVGEEITLHIIRSQKEMTIPVILEARP